MSSTKIGSWALSVGLVIGLLPLTAAAQERDSGFEVGGRVGFAVPIGKVEGSDRRDLSAVLSGSIPLGLDFGYRIDRRWFAGIYAQYGIGFLHDDVETYCDAEHADCSTGDLHGGLEAHYHIAPEATFDPWLGLGIGYEWLFFSEKSSMKAASSVNHGFELFNLQAGVDLQLVERIVIGPFLSLSLDEFRRVSGECIGSYPCNYKYSESIDDNALHAWFTAGVRASFGP